MTVPSRRSGWALVAAALVLAGPLTACAHQVDHGGPQASIRVGLLVSLSGTYQTVGTDMRDGFRLYLSTHGNQLGGHPVQLSIADEGDGPPTALPAATKMIKQDKVDVLTGIVGGGSVAAIAPLAAQAHIPLVGSNGRPDLKDVTWVWHTSFLSDEPGAAIAGYVHDTVRGPVYAIGPDYQGGWDELRGFSDAFVKAGGQVANPEGKTTFTPFPQTTDFTPYFAKIRASGAKAVYCFYAGKAAIDFVTQYAMSDVKDVPLYAAGFLTEGAVLPAQGTAAAGIQTVLNYAPDLDNAANRAFVSAWQADTVKHNGPPTTYAMASWDAAALLDKAVAAAGAQPTPTSINTAIGRLGQINSPRGPWQFSPKTHSPVQKWYLRRVQGDGSALANVVVSDLATLGSTG
jgi:branched-chain amino acid transport system substrate-binding protein